MGGGEGERQERRGEEREKRERKRRESKHAQMQDIKSLVLFPGNCGPLHTDLGVSTMKPEVTERKLLSLNSTLLYSNTDLITRDLGVCILQTG